jgi:hypothetical protein
VIPSGDDDHLGSITDDGLTITWTTSSDSRIVYADRPSRGDKFNKYSKLPTTVIADGYPAIDRTAVSSDGLRVIIVSADHKRFGQVARHTREDLFDTFINEAPFTALNSSTGPAESLGDPVLMGDDRTLYFSRYGLESGPTVFVAYRADEKSSWVIQGAVGGPELEAVGGLRRRLTGVSADQLTFFYFDETVGHARAARRPALDQPAGAPFELPAWQAVLPNRECSELYLARGAVGALDLFVLRPL